MLIIFILACFLILLDQLSKNFIVNHFSLGESKEVIVNFFSISSIIVPKTVVIIYSRISIKRHGFGNDFGFWYNVIVIYGLNIL